MKRISKLEAFQFMNEEHFAEYERIIKHLELNYYVAEGEIFFDLEEENNVLCITFKVSNIDTGQDYIKEYNFDVSKKIGRPTIGITKKVSLTLPEEVWEKLEETRKEEGISRSALLRDIVEHYYDPTETEDLYCRSCEKVTNHYVAEIDTSDDYEESNFYFVKCKTCGFGGECEENEYRKLTEI